MRPCGMWLARVPYVDQAMDIRTFFVTLFPLLCILSSTNLLIYYLLILLFSVFESYKLLTVLQVHATFSHMVLIFCTLFPSPFSLFFHISLPPPSPSFFSSSHFPSLSGILILPSNLKLKSGEFCLGLTLTGCSIFTVAPLPLALMQVRSFLGCMLYFGDCERAPN